MIAPRRKCPSSRHASGRCRVSSRLRALHWHPDPTPRLIPARARSSASSHLASTPFPAHASSRPASVPYPCRAHRHVSSRLRAALASRARPAASPHPDCPPCPAPRLIPASLPAAAASRPDSALHWHPGPPRLSPSLASAPASPQPQPRLSPSLASAPASPACRPDPEPLGLNKTLPDPRAFGREKGFGRLASLQPSPPLLLIQPRRRASS